MRFFIDEKIYFFGRNVIYTAPDKRLNRCNICAFADVCYISTFSYYAGSDFSAKRHKYLGYCTTTCYKEI